MGDRICLSFVNDEMHERSPCLYAHWAGIMLLDSAEAFWDCYNKEIRDEPSNVMVNFLNWLLQGKIMDGNYYLYKDEDHACSPDDNGFWEFDVVTGVCRKYHRHDWEKE